MLNFYNKYFQNLSIHYLISIFFFSFFINYYYADLGSFPIDTFLHYDSAYRILKNEYPIQDYWVVSGIVVDFIQALFFKFFGVNWTAYKLHSSLFNAGISLFAFNYFLTLKLSHFKSLIYTISFSILAYTVSGTPFVDHHAAFFLLLSTFLIIKIYSKKNNFILWTLAIIFILLSFLSKQVPIIYAIFFQATILLYFILKGERFDLLRLIIIISLSLLFICFLFFFILKIDLKLFFIEYIKYPITIGSERFKILDNSFEDLFNQFKYLIIPICLSIFIKLHPKLKYIKIEQDSDLKFIFILITALSLILHQLLTKNQIFIYFLVPIFFAILDSDIKNMKIKYKKYFSYILILSIILITTKYHFRYNEERKFHEMVEINLNDSIDAKIIHESLEGLKWINPSFNGKPSEEAQIIKNAVNLLDSKDYEVMLITHYLFIDSITKNNMNFPSRTFTTDGVSFPVVGNKNFKVYKDFLNKKIAEKKIKEIYFIKHENISQEVFENYYAAECFKKEENNLFLIYKITCST